jgi:hypothetical protein
MTKSFGWTMVVVGAIGVWAGVSAYGAPSVLATIEAALAVLLSGHLLFCLWLWRRAEPGSGDAMIAPTLVLVPVPMLLLILPRVLWPTAESVHIAGPALSVIVAAGILVTQLRRRRRLNRERPGGQRLPRH